MFSSTSDLEKCHISDIHDAHLPLTKTQEVSQCQLVGGSGGSSRVVLRSADMRDLDKNLALCAVAEHSPTKRNNCRKTRLTIKCFCFFFCAVDSNRKHGNNSHVCQQQGHCNTEQTVLVSSSVIQWFTHKTYSGVRQCR